MKEAMLLDLKRLDLPDDLFGAAASKGAGGIRLKFIGAVRLAARSIVHRAESLFAA